MKLFDDYKTNNEASGRLNEKAQGHFPGGICHNMRLFEPYPFYAKSSIGATVTDEDGHELIDLWMGHYAMILGHAPVGPMEAAAEALKSGWHWGIPSENQILLADELVDAAPMLEKLRFCCTGTEATMYAVRLARAFTDKPWVLKVAGGWHGASTDLSFSVKAPFCGAEGPGLLDPDAQCIDHLHFNDIEASEEVFEAREGKIAAVIVEPLIGAGGFIPGKQEYLEYLREKCDRSGAVLIFDEIISGFRFRYGLLADEYGVTPDMVTLGKIIGGGFPIGVFGGREEIMELANPANTAKSGKSVLVGGGTFSCNPITLAGALATLRTLKDTGDTLYPQLARLGDRVRAGIKQRFADVGLPVGLTGKGSLFMTHILKGEDDRLESPTDLAEKTHYTVKDRELKIALLNRGVYSVHGGGSLSAAHDEKTVEKILDAYGGAAGEIKPLVT